MAAGTLQVSVRGITTTDSYRGSRSAPSNLLAPALDWTQQLDEERARMAALITAEKRIQEGVGGLMIEAEKRLKETAEFVRESADQIHLRQGLWEAHAKDKLGTLHGSRYVSTSEIRSLYDLAAFVLHDNNSKQMQMHKVVSEAQHLARSLGNEAVHEFLERCDERCESRFQLSMEELARHSWDDIKPHDEGDEIGRSYWKFRVIGELADTYKLQLSQCVDDDEQWNMPEMQQLGVAVLSWIATGAQHSQMTPEDCTGVIHLDMCGRVAEYGVPIKERCIEVAHLHSGCLKNPKRQLEHVMLRALLLRCAASMITDSSGMMDQVPMSITIYVPEACMDSLPSLEDFGANDWNVPIKFVGI